MAGAYFRAVIQLFDPRLWGIVVKSVLLALAAAIASIVVLAWGIAEIPAVEAWMQADGWLGKAAAAIPFLGGIGGALLAWLAFPAIASAVIAVFQDDIADAVEARYYPNDPPGTPLGARASLGVALRFLGLALAATLAALLVALVAAPLFPFAFYLFNGYVLGRDYFEFAARRHADAGQVAALAGRHRWRLAAGGTVAALLLTLPLVNLLAPVVATAAMVHVFKRLAALPSAVPTARG